jgi:REP element-mobilizing transposase RayT
MSGLWERLAVYFAVAASKGTRQTTMLSIAANPMWFGRQSIDALVLSGAMAKRCAALIRKVAATYDAEIIASEIVSDHVHFIGAIDPQFGIHRLVKNTQGLSSHALRTKFPVFKSCLPALRINSSLVSTVAGHEARSTRVGHFAILSELAKSPTGTVDKPNDPQSNQAIAPKVMQRDAIGDRAEVLKTCVTVPAVLSSGKEGRAW